LLAQRRPQRCRAVEPPMKQPPFPRPPVRPPALSTAFTGKAIS
jgi:hypothetical protein